MTRDELLPTMITMENYGGSFAKNLAKAMLNADEYNLQRIVNAFPELIERYAAFAKIADKPTRVRCINTEGLGTHDKIILGGEYTIKNAFGDAYHLVEFGDSVWYHDYRFEVIE